MLSMTRSSTQNTGPHNVPFCKFLAGVFVKLAGIHPKPVLKNASRFTIAHRRYFMVRALCNPEFRVDTV